MAKAKKTVSSVANADVFQLVSTKSQPTVYPLYKDGIIVREVYVHGQAGIGDAMHKARDYYATLITKEELEALRANSSVFCRHEQRGFLKAIPTSSDMGRQAATNKGTGRIVSDRDLEKDADADDMAKDDKAQQLKESQLPPGIKEYKDSGE